MFSRLLEKSNRVMFWPTSQGSGKLHLTTGLILMLLSSALFVLTGNFFVFLTAIFALGISIASFGIVSLYASGGFAVALRSVSVLTFALFVILLVWDLLTT